MGAYAKGGEHQHARDTSVYGDIIRREMELALNLHAFEPKDAAPESGSASRLRTCPGVKRADDDVVEFRRF
jgi:hypothetical protein